MSCISRASWPVNQRVTWPITDVGSNKHPPWRKTGGTQNGIPRQMSGTNRDDNLSPTEVEQFGKLEATVKRGLETRLELVEALADIRDARLHRDTHETFEAYLRERWRLDPQPELTSLSSE